VLFSMFNPFKGFNTLVLKAELFLFCAFDFP
jgi:hypothetical protein